MTPVDLIVDLRNQLPPIKFQGGRPTCMAFAASDCHTFCRGDKEPLSVEYAFFNAVRRTAARNPNVGVGPLLMAQALRIDGQPFEADWQYLPQVTSFSDWTPPNTIGQLFMRDSQFGSTTVKEITIAHDSGLPAIVVTQITESFIRLQNGEVCLNTQESPKKNLHAILSVGYGKLDEEIVLLVRNSWGVGWATDGYGYVHESYLAPRLRDVMTMI